MTEAPSKVRQNYYAILTAAVACFALEAGWYTVFLQPWLNGIGRTMAELTSPGAPNPAFQYAIALIASAVLAAAISRVTQVSGPQTALRGMKVAAMLWVGFVLTTITTEYVFEVRPLSLYAINEGFWLLGMIIMGAIVGAWKRKQKAMA
jgi:hypothetical protein